MNHYSDNVFVIIFADESKSSQDSIRLPQPIKTKKAKARQILSAETPR